MPRIAVIEDDPDLQTVLQFNLRAAGHEPLPATAGASGLALVRQRQPELVVLDVMLPDLNGIQVCRALKADARTAAIPVLMLTAKGMEDDRIAGLQAGADDYVVKPFSVRELLLRVAALLRRTQLVTAASGICVGALFIDRDAHRASVDGAAIELTALEFKLLWTLAERRERVQTRAQLVEAVWGAGADVDDRAVDTQVKRLRERIGSAACLVQTVRGAGYRLSIDAAQPTQPA